MKKIKTLFSKPRQSLRKARRSFMYTISYILHPIDVMLSNHLRKKRVCYVKTCFAIISWHRSGSTYLCDLLNSHSEITCHFELFRGKGSDLAPGLSLEMQHKLPSHKTLVLLPRYSIEKTLYITASVSEAVGFKIFPHQHPGAFQYVLKESTLKKIILERENFLKRFISKKIMQQTGIAKSIHGQYQDRKIQIPLNELETFRSNEKKVFERIKKALQVTKQDTLNITYEELLAKPKIVTESIFSHLQIKRTAKLTTQLEKQNKRPTRYYIENEKEVERYLRSINCEVLLDNS